AFRSHSDTEVVLKIYERYGPDSVRELEGMFALAIWDEQEQTCFLARDPLGIKPLYYYETNGAIWFASELRTLLGTGVVPRRLSFRDMPVTNCAPFAFLSMIRNSTKGMSRRTPRSILVRNTPIGGSIPPQQKNCSRIS